MRDDDDDLAAEVESIAHETRRVLEQLDATSHEAARRVRDAIPGDRSAFPDNWCGFASCVLGLRLARILRRGDIDQCRWDGTGGLEAHFWLRIGDLDIDITADQFGEDLKGVVVEAGSVLHRRWFPNPGVVPLLARKPSTRPFEIAVVHLDEALRAESSRADAIRCLRTIGDAPSPS
jgi:hypothetical protein